MPENRLMYIAIVLIVAAAGIWIGAELTRRVEWTVPYLGGAGIALLINAFLRLDGSGRRLAISCPAGSQLRAFEVTALDRELPMYETREDALAAVGGS